MSATKQIEVTILGQQYRLAVQLDAEAALLEAVARVDAEMTKVRASSSVRGQDRIAVMAALSIASDLLKLQQSVRFGEAFPAEEIKHTLTDMNQRISAAVDNLEKY